jgi:hypothetical protein
VGLTQGRNSPDIKVSKSIGNTPYTNLFVVSGVIEELTTDFQLVSPLPLISTLPHRQLNTPSKVFVASTSNDDSGTGIGGRVLFITGLDEFYNILEEIVVLDGQNPVETTNVFSKVFEILVITYGTNIEPNTGDSNVVGDLYCGTGAFVNGIPANPITGIARSQNNPNSRDGIFTVPDGKLLLIKGLLCGTQPDNKENIALIVQLSFNLFGFGEELFFKTEPFIFNGTFHYLPEFNLPFPPRTDIQLRAKITTVSPIPSDVKTAIVSLECELQDLRG